ncbi:cadmium translocating P-type ATPase CadA, putative [Staphylococcus aureus]|nr:cadmium translocating P-type ATPase CadA, putative [Staphylococcus aureus]
MVTDFKVLNDQVEEKELFSIITALEYRSQHPLASAIMKKAEQDILLIPMLEWRTSLLLQVGAFKGI